MANNNKPLVSIGMPVWNCKRTLRPALRSLLAQTYTNWELLLIDDGSSDGTLRVAQQFNDPRIKIYSDGKNRGASFRRNQAIAMSRGEYYAIMDGDDMSYPKRLETQVNYLELHTDVHLVGAEVMVFCSDGIALGKRPCPENHDVICAKPFAGFPMAQPTFLGRLDWFRRYGYRDEVRLVEDQDLLIRSYRCSRFANVPEILLGYREERIDIKKILKTRLFFTQTLVKEFQRQGRYVLVSRIALEQTLKAIVECAAIASGLNYRLLPHRARSATLQERQKWLEIWRLVNQETTNVQD